MVENTVRFENTNGFLWKTHFSRSSVLIPDTVSVFPAVLVSTQFLSGFHALFTTTSVVESAATGYQELSVFAWPSGFGSSMKSHVQWKF